MLTSSIRAGSTEMMGRELLPTPSTPLCINWLHLQRGAVVGGPGAKMPHTRLASAREGTIKAHVRGVRWCGMKRLLCRLALASRAKVRRRKQGDLGP
ncbi:hypothetical protein PSPO01_11239 [Paraphaeosphaeria sporulosa]